MKVIPKLQDGGFLSLFTRYTPLQQTTSQPSRARSQARETSESKKEEGNITKKDLLNIVDKVDGLPNDMGKVIKDIEGMLDIQQISGSSDISDLTNIYFSNIYQLKLAQFNKKEYDKAYIQASNKGGLNEYAVTDTGHIISTDKKTGGLKPITVDEYLNNPDKYDLLTNSNLLYLRAWSPSYTNKNGILDTVSNGIGMEEVSKLVKNNFNSLGTSDNIRQGYSVKEGKYIYQGYSVLSELESKNIADQAGMTLDGLYENEVITKDQRQQAQAALEYIYNMLPTNAKTLLKLKAGNAKNPTAGARDLIFQMITSTVDFTSSYKSTYKGTLEENLNTSSDNSGDKGSKDVKASQYLDIVKGIGGTYSHIVINPGTNTEMDVDGISYPTLQDTKKEPVGRTSLNNLLHKGIGGISTDLKGITFGSKILTDTDLDHIMYDGNGGVRAILPAKIVNGVKVVDLNSIQRWEDAKNEMERQNLSMENENDKQKIIKILYDKELDQLIDAKTGDFNYKNFGVFLLLDSYAVEKEDGSTFSRYNEGNRTVKNDFITAPSEVPDEVVKTIEEALSTNDKKDNYKINNPWFFGSKDKIYRGTVYIPITQNQNQAIIAAGQEPAEHASTTKEYEYQIFTKKLSQKKGPSDLLL